MVPTAEQIYDKMCCHSFKKINELFQDGFSGMYVVLKIIYDSNTELSVGDISEIFKVTTARTAVILSTLEKKGLILKLKSEFDARKTIVKITEKGIKELLNRKTKILEMINCILLKFSDEDKETLYNLICKILS